MEQKKKLNVLKAVALSLAGSAVVTAAGCTKTNDKPAPIVSDTPSVSDTSSLEETSSIVVSEVEEPVIEDLLTGKYVFEDSEAQVDEKLDALADSGLETLDKYNFEHDLLMSQKLYYVLNLEARGITKEEMVNTYLVLMGIEPGLKISGERYLEIIDDIYTLNYDAVAEYLNTKDIEALKGRGGELKLQFTDDPKASYTYGPLYNSFSLIKGCYNVQKKSDSDEYSGSFEAYEKYIGREIGLLNSYMSSDKYQNILPISQYSVVRSGKSLIDKLSPILCPDGQYTNKGQQYELTYFQEKINNALPEMKQKALNSISDGSLEKIECLQLDGKSIMENQDKQLVLNN